MEITKYRDQKQKQMTRVVSVGNAFVLIRRRFDPDTGDEVEPVTAAFDIAQMEAEKARLQAVIDEIDELIADAESAKSEAVR